MGRKPKEVNEELRQKRREQILDAALQIYIEAGFNGADMDMVAERAGLAKGLVYYYYPTKRELFQALFNRCLERTTEMEQALIQSLSTLQPVEKLVHYAWSMFSFARSEPLLLRFAMRLPFDAYAVFGAEGWQEGMRRANLHQESMSALIRDLMDTGLVVTPDSAWAASTLWAVFVANFLNFVKMSGGEKGDRDHGSRPADIEQIRSMFAFCFRGLGLPEPEWAPVIERLMTENFKEEK